MFIRLSDADRARLGCPEWIEFDQGRMSAREAATIQTETGLTPDELLAAIGGARREVSVDDGATWTEWQPASRDEEPPGRLRVIVDWDAWAAAVWVALRRAGVDVPITAVDFDVYAFAVRPTDPAVAGGDAGKADTGPSTPPPASTP